MTTKETPVLFPLNGWVLTKIVRFPYDKKQKEVRIWQELLTANIVI